RAYYKERRRKFGRAWEEVRAPLVEWPEKLGVIWSGAKKISARRSRTGEVDAPVWRHGPVSRVTPAVQEWIRRQIRAQPDVTLQELRERLEEAQQLRLSMGRMWVALRQLGLPLKKKRSLRRSGEASQRNNTAKPGA